VQSSCRLCGLGEFQLTAGMPSRPRMQSLGWQRVAEVGIANADLKRRHQRLYEIELPDGQTYLQKLPP